MSRCHLALVFALLSAAACERDGRGAYARVVTAPDQLVGGPGASGDLGDVVLGNDAIRVVIARRKPAQGSLPVTGVIIDAGPMRAAEPASGGRDHLEGIFPLAMVSGFDPDSSSDVFVLDNGSGGTAVVRAIARPRDLLRALEVLGGDLTPNRDLVLETDYVLEPNARHVRVISRLRNEGEDDALLDGSVLRRQLNLAGSTAPGDVELVFGDGFVTGRRARLFVPGAVPTAGEDRPMGFDVVAAAGLARASPPGLPALPGVPTDLLVAVGEGVSYGWAPAVPASRNATLLRRDLYVEQGFDVPARNPMVVTYAAAGGASVHHGLIPERLGPGELVEFERLFVVGDGDVASVRQELARVRGLGTGVLLGEVVSDPGGAPVPGGELVIYDADQRPFSHARLDSEGRFRVVLPPGSYFLRAIAPGAPPTPLPAALRAGVEIEAGASVYRQLALSAPSAVVVRASDPSGRLLPAKVSVVGEYDDRGREESVDQLLNALEMGERPRPTDLGELKPLLERTRRYVESVGLSAEGAVRVPVRPTRCDGVPSCSVDARADRYTIVVSRGPEYELAVVEGVEVAPGELVTHEVTLERTVNTEGYLAVDFDLKSDASPQGSRSAVMRARAAAAEGIEAYFGADRNRIVDTGAEPRAAGVQTWVRGFDAMELTTLERGANVLLPLVVNPTRANGLPEQDGCIVGSGADSLGILPDGLECSMPQLFGRSRTLSSRGTAFSVLVASHPRRGFEGQLNQLYVSGAGETTEPSPLNDRWAGWPLSTSYRAGALDPASFLLSELDGLMVWHGKETPNVRDFRAPRESELDPALANDLLLDLRNYQCGDGHPNNALGGVVYREGGDIAFPGPVSDFERQIGLGRPMVALAASGSGGLEREPGAPRTYVWVGDDDERGVLDRRPALVSDADVLNGVFQGRLLLTNGPFLDLRLRTPSAAGDGVLIWPVGSFVRYATPPNPDTGARVTALLRLRSPSWINVDTVRIRVNGEVVETLSVPDAGDSDGGDIANEWFFPVELTLFEDAFVSAEAEGAGSLFPVVTPYREPRGGIDGAVGAIAQAFGLPDPYARGDGLRAPTPVAEARPLAVTNPILLDVDASGAFRGPGVAELPPRAPELPCPPGLE